ncbi:MAG: hypothetical protein H0U25_12165 [Thermoleophilaceae bacterium]|nr:hypothetical protein [Thermoleophilaceae bacterium]
MTSEAPSPEQATPQQGREGFPVVRVAALLGVRWMLRGLTIGIVGVCVVALITRTLPEVWPIDRRSETSG